jgi:hypothetical protein
LTTGREDLEAGRATSARASIVAETHLRGWRIDRACPSVPRAPPAGRRDRPWFPAGTPRRAVRCDETPPSRPTDAAAKNVDERFVPPRALFRDWPSPGNGHTASRTTHARSFAMVLAKGKLGDPKDPAGVVKFKRPVRRALRRDLSPASFRHFSRASPPPRGAPSTHPAPPRPIRRNSSTMRSRRTCGRSALSSSASSASP